MLIYINEWYIYFNYSIQTNGLLIDDKWCNLFKDNDFLAVLSFDIIENIHNKYRTGINN